MTTARTEARNAALLALDGLDRWLDAFDYMAKAEDRQSDRTEDFDVYLAIELNALRQHVGVEWWTANRAALLAVASKDERTKLSNAARAGEGIVIMLERIGDAGPRYLRTRAGLRREALRKLQPSDEAEAATSSRQSPEVSVAVSTATDPGGSPDRIDSDPESERQIEQLDAAIETFDADLKKFETEWAESLADLRAKMDHRLWLVRDTYNSFMASRQKFEEAAATCRLIERRHRRRLSVLR